MVTTTVTIPFSLPRNPWGFFYGKMACRRMPLPGNIRGWDGWARARGWGGCVGFSGRTLNPRRICLQTAEEWICKTADSYIPKQSISLFPCNRNIYFQTTEALIAHTVDYLAISFVHHFIYPSICGRIYSLCAYCHSPLVSIINHCN